MSLGILPIFALQEVMRGRLTSICCGVDWGMRNLQAHAMHHHHSHIHGRR